MTLPATPTVWEEGREPGREVASLGVALALTTACLDLTITGGLSLLFDIGFVLVCLAVALAVRPRDFFTVGVLPPLLMLGTFVLLAMSQTAGVGGPGQGEASAVLNGLGDHSIALALGYLGTLGILLTRRRVAGQRARVPMPVRRTDPGRRLPA